MKITKQELVDLIKEELDALTRSLVLQFQILVNGEGWKT